MSTLRRVVKNISVTFISNNLLKVVSTVLVILIARYLGDVEYGKFSFALSFTGLFLIAMDLGTRILIVREITQKKKEASKIVANVLMLKFISSFLVYALILIIAFSLNYSKETFVAIAIAGVGLIFDSLSTTVGSIFQAFERLEIPAFTRLIRIVIRFAFTIPLLVKGSSFLLVLVVYAAVHLLDFLISLAICYSKFVSLIFDFDKKLILDLIKRSFPFLLSGIFVTVYFRIDITLMSKLAPTSLYGFYSNVQRDAVIGWYSSAYNLLDAVTSIAGAVSAAILPVAVMYYQQSKEKLVRLYSLSVKALIYLSIPVSVGTTLLADKIILLLYKQEYINAGLALKILIWTIVPLCVNYMMGAVMIAVHEEKKGVYVLFMNAVINILLNLWLIPKYSLYGAAAATVLTELFYFVGYYYIISKTVHRLNILKIMFKPVIASVIMGFLIYYLKSFNIFILVFLGFILYTALMFLLKALSQDDKELIKRIFIEKKV